MAADDLKSCDIIFGCVDGYSERQQLEAHCRRFLIPLIDIGMDVHPAGKHFGIGGQVILSLPGDVCMECIQFLTLSKLGLEAAAYGHAGGAPQVVWSNGVLASTAVGVAVDLLTDWSGTLRGSVYQSYDGSRHLLFTHPRISAIGDMPCPCCGHYLLENIGPPRAAAS